MLRPWTLVHASRALLVVACWFGAATAQGLAPYTVQVAALSDSDAAIDLSGVLLRDGFPSYVVRAEGAAGSVFRVRVGAFGDRSIAERYARAMAQATGSEPRPALAEAIPSGILPLAPSLWFRLEPGDRAALVPWTDLGRAARIVRADGATRYLLEDGTDVPAWWARALAGGGREEVAEIRLDDEGGSDDEPSVRDALFRQRLRLVAERGDLDVERLIDEAVRGDVGSRTVIVWQVVPAQGEASVRGVLLREADPASRDAADWLGGVPPEPVEPSARLDATAAADAAPLGAVAGDGWSASVDGPWTVLTVADTTWRALAGAPRVAFGDVLVVSVDGGLEAVRLLPR